MAGSGMVGSGSLCKVSMAGTWTPSSGGGEGAVGAELRGPLDRAGNLTRPRTCTLPRMGKTVQLRLHSLEAVLLGSEACPEGFSVITERLRLAYSHPRRCQRLTGRLEKKSRHLGFIKAFIVRPAEPSPVFSGAVEVRRRG